jgi:hypothetical protein
VGDHGGAQPPRARLGGGDAPRRAPPRSAAAREGRALSARRTARRAARSALAALALGAPLLAPGAAPRARALELASERIAQGLAEPVFLAAPPGDARLFVLERAGRIQLLDAAGAALGTFLDLEDRVDAEGEGGLLGLAFAPDWSSSGHLYVYYTTGDPAVMQDLESRLSRFTAQGDPASALAADPASESIVFSIDQPFRNHNGGTIALRGGFLYLGLGDGGGSGDPSDRAQDPGSLLGKMLRFDLGEPTPAPEVWAKGFRNPFRFAFDGATGDLYVGDVGEARLEEIDVELAPEDPEAPPPLHNYGWDVEEGSECFDPDPGEPACGDPSLVRPVHEYLHQAGRCAVTGGVVYRGGAIPALRGTYLFGDFCTGEVWSFELDREAGTISALVDRSAELAPGDGSSIDELTAFGEDAEGEVYLVDKGGELFRVLPEPPAPARSLAAALSLALAAWQRRARATP